MINEEKEYMSLDIYGVRYDKLTSNEKWIIDKMYSKIIMKNIETEVENGRD